MTTKTKPVYRLTDAEANRLFDAGHAAADLRNEEETPAKKREFDKIHWASCVALATGGRKAATDVLRLM